MLILIYLLPCLFALLEPALADCVRLHRSQGACTYILEFDLLEALIQLDFVLAFFEVFLVLCFGV